MAPVSLEREDHVRDAEFKKAMHGKSAAEQSHFMAMMKKDSASSRAAVDEYFRHWDNKAAANETEQDREERKAQYATLTRHYYDIATGFYETAWGQSFHFCRFGYGEPFVQALARHEHYLALMMGLKKGMKVLDVGCGVGGPAREIARFADVHVTGLNNNDYQIERAGAAAAKVGLSEQLDFVKGDFMQMSFPANSFDAVYAIEATVHAPSLEGVYSQIFRVLKPGGTFGVYEWLMTEHYNNDDPEHRRIRLGIEQGDGISNMVKIQVALDAIKAAGFELELNEDLAQRPDPTPWYYPIAGEFKHMTSLWDVFTVLRMTKLGRGAVHQLLGALETVRLAPSGTQKTAGSLALAADCLVEGAKKELFTPMYLMIARKPKA